MRATLLLLASTLFAGAQAAAQPAGPSDNDLARIIDAPARGSTVAPDELFRTFLEIRGALDAWTPPQAELLTTAGAARVTLYMDGRAVGAASAGVSTRGDAIARAAANAMAEAERALLPRRDAMWREQIRTLSGELLLALEVAGPLTPLSENELANPGAAVRPGIDGLAARVGEEWALVFPSEQARAGTTPDIDLPALAAGLLGDALLGLELPRDLATEHGVTFYRFETTCLAGVGESGAPEILTRGGRVVEPREITVASLAAFAEHMLTHLERREIGGDLHLGLAGTIHSTRGVAEPPIATPTQQALICLALLNLAETPQIAPEARERALALAARVLVDLQVVEEYEVEPSADGVAMAVVWVALARLGDEARAAHGLGPLWEEAGSMMSAHAEAEPSEPTGSVAESILVWAMAERAARDGVDRQRAAADLEAMLRSARPGALVGQLPWIGWAALALSPTGELAAAPVFRQLREQVWVHQLSEDDTGPLERDLAGGIIFTRGFVALPTWSATRPVAFLSTMLGDERLTTRDERPAEAVRLLASMRFLSQLSARGAECHAYPESERSIGGVRAAPWDHRMPPEATAMTLLSVTEFLRALASAEAAD